MSSNIFKILLFFTFTFVFLFKANAQEGKKIELIHAKVLRGGSDLGEGVKRLIGDVAFKHENAIMYCDSAYFNSKYNTVDAYSNVHIIQDDSLDLYGDFLFYDGNTKIAKVRDNVRMENGESRLTTDFLDYDRNTNIATYFNHGTIIDKNNNLQSNNGFYYTDLKDYYAIDSVVLINPEYKMLTDTLRYNTSTDISFFYGPTEIISDSNYIYCENGWYDTQKDVSQFNKNAFLRKGEKTLSGDSLYYDRVAGFGEAFKNIVLEDTTQKVILKGDYAVYYEIEEKATITKRAQMIQVTDNDSLFLHSDTIKLVTFFDTLIVSDITILYQVYNNENDSTLDSNTINNNKDTIATNKITESNKFQAKNNIVSDSLKYFSDTTITDSIGNKYRIREREKIKPRKEIYAYNKVRIYKTDFQAKCDSLAYLTADSVLQFFSEPILWSEENQVSGINIDLHMANNEADYMLIKKDAMISSEEDTIRYDQISGKKIIAYFKNNEIHKIYVTGNSESVYFPREEAPKDSLTNDTLVTDSSYTKVEKEPVKGDLVGANIASVQLNLRVILLAGHIF
jgi:lipopolysaccharide export system protein LptA